MNPDFIIHTGWLINGKGEPVKKNVFISIKNGYIHSITDSPEEDNNVIDLSSSTILPGLIDCHVHLAWSGTDDPKTRKNQINADFDRAKDNIDNNLNRHLSCGVLCVRDGGDKNGNALKYKNEYRNNKKIRISSPGYALYKPGRYGSILGVPVKTLDDLFKMITNTGSINTKGIDHIKIVNSGLNSLINFGEQTDPQFTTDELESAVNTAKKMDLGIMVHANGEIPVKEAIQAGCSSIEHGFFMGKDNMKRMADRNIFWVPTAVTMKVYSEHSDINSTESNIAKKNLDHQIEQIRLAREFGGPVVTGTDAGGMGVVHGESVINEMEIFTIAGYSITEAVHCATGRAAELLNLNDTGRIEPGMRADMISVSTDPDNLISGLRSGMRVFIEGKEIKN